MVAGATDQEPSVVAAEAFAVAVALAAAADWPAAVVVGAAAGDRPVEAHFALMRVDAPESAVDKEVVEIVAAVAAVVPGRLSFCQTD